VDYVVAETGLGGLLDGTNIVQNSTKICVITDIGLDHTHILGDTLVKIAAQKAGIMHAGNQTFVYRQTPEVDEVLRNYARKQAATLHTWEQADLARRFGPPGLNKLPLFQQRNWLLARAACDYVAQRDGWQFDHNQVAATLSVQVPGRMDEWRVHGKTVVMDGAHNQQKMQAFIASFQQKYPGGKVPILLTLKEGKEYQDILPQLRSIGSRLIITTYDLLQDLPARSMDPEKLAATAREYGFEDVKVLPDARQAVRALLDQPEELVVITGSFYLLSCVRPLILKA
jgi:dihydrofolate synthase/folylpolyglutamate synthase